MTYNEYRKVVDAIIEYGQAKWKFGITYDKLLNGEVNSDELSEVEKIASERLSDVLNILLDK